MKLDKAKLVIIVQFAPFMLLRSPIEYNQLDRTDEYAEFLAAYAIAELRKENDRNN